MSGEPGGERGHLASRARMLVSGRVQGVGYRAFAQRHARALGLRGWVRNCSDGCVELVVEGERGAIERFAALLWEGPRWAQVASVDIDWHEYTGEFTSFEVREWW